MGLLRSFAGAVVGRAFRDEISTEAIPDQLPGFLLGLLGNPGGIGANIGYQAHGLALADINSFV